jgi:biopolymer transport protein ExbD
LVSVAVYTNLAVIDMNLPPDVTAIAKNSLPSEKPKVKLTVVISQDYCAITLADKMLDSISCKKGEYPLDSLTLLLKNHRQSLEIKDEVIVASGDPILFKYIVRVMDACKKAGFEKINLASATQNPNKGF